MVRLAVSGKEPPGSMSAIAIYRHLADGFWLAARINVAIATFICCNSNMEVVSHERDPGRDLPKASG